MQFQGKWTGLEFRPTIINCANQVQLQQSILHHTRKDDIDTESDMEIISSTLQWSPITNCFDCDQSICRASTRENREALLTRWVDAVIFWSQSCSATCKAFFKSPVYHLSSHMTSIQDRQWVERYTGAGSSRRGEKGFKKAQFCLKFCFFSSAPFSFTNYRLPSLQFKNLKTSDVVVVNCDLFPSYFLRVFWETVT